MTPQSVAFIQKMYVYSIILKLRCLGVAISIAPDGVNLLARPKSNITNEARQVIKALKLELLDYLKSTTENQS